MCLFNFHVSSTRLTTVSFLLKYTIAITTANLEALTLLPLEASGRMEGVGGKGGGVPHGYIFVENSWTANDLKLKLRDFKYFFYGK